MVRAEANGPGNLVEIVGWQLLRTKFANKSDKA